MSVQAIPLVVSILFAALLGFAAHRASVCTVRAVAEVLSARTAFMLACIGKSALWVIAIILPALWLLPSAAAGIGGWQLTAAALGGGFAFGIGAAINGACAYSTMTRLVDGEVRMLLSIVSFAVGVFVFAALADQQWLSRPAKAPAMIGSVLHYAIGLSVILLAWALYEAQRVWRKRTAETKISDLVLAPQYRLSTAALLIGVSGSIIFLLFGSPGYTVTLQGIAQGVVGMGAMPAPAKRILLLAVLGGMLISTLQRGSFRFDWRPQTSWLRNILGGALMGFGTALTPGGNDALILYGIPGFSPHALPAFVALGVGAALGLLAMKYLAGIDSRVVCTNDTYYAEAQPRGSILNGHAPRGSA